MSCKECERLRRKLSPKEDPDYTASYRLVEPVEFIREKCCVKRNGVQMVVVAPKSLFKQAFGYEGNNRELMLLGRSLRALGWEHTKRGGFQFFSMTLEEFNDGYSAQ